MVRGSSLIRSKPKCHLGSLEEELRGGDAEQLDARPPVVGRGGNLQRIHRDNMLASQVQPLLAGHDHLEARAATKQLRHHTSSGDQVLEAVQDQEQLLVAQRGASRSAFAPRRRSHRSHGR